MKKKNIVIIGGGSRSAWLLNGFVKHRDKYDLAVVGSMADNGGSTGRLCRELDVLPFGALRKCLLALSDADDDIKKAFAYRFEKGELAGHAMGNIFMAALEKTSGSAERALERAHKFLKVNGRVIPASFDRITLFAELENGEIIEGETNIDIPKHDGNLKIKRIFLDPVPKANQEALNKISDADLVIIGPGDLYSTILPNFLVPGISEAVEKTRAKKLFIVNPWNKFGETNNFLVDDFVSEAEKYLGAEVDHAIYNSEILSDNELIEYKKTKPMFTGMVRAGKDLDKNKFIGRDMLEKTEPRIDVDKLVNIIMEVKL